MSSQKLEIGDILISKNNLDLEVYFPLAEYNMLDNSIRQRSIFYFENEDEFFEIAKLNKEQVRSIDHINVQKKFTLKRLIMEFTNFKVSKSEIQKDNNYNYNFICVYDLKEKKETKIGTNHLNDLFINFSDYL